MLLDNKNRLDRDPNYQKRSQKDTQTNDILAIDLDLT